ncbi:MAG: hypothetical protein BMS9Abin20_1218 [Acidimicrobiia bacterium]|nr:MAG: hypothetical protein BMS9Abin20_1218 [Acidimicrobiia bacterium]
MKLVVGLSLAVALVVAACSSAAVDDPSTEPTNPTSSTTTTAPVTSLPPPPTTSIPTTTTTVPADTEPPGLESVPTHGQVLDRYSFDFVGSTEPGTLVTVNDEPVVVDDDGNFEYPVTNDLGTNTVIVALADDAGNSATHRISYEFEPPDDWIAAIGDSVMLGSEREIEKRLGGEDIVDATVSRQFLDAPELVAELVKQPEPPQVIIIGLGTNGPAQAQHFDEVMEAAGEERLMVFVNVHVPTRGWEATTNRTLAEGVERYDNAVLVDWFTPTEGREDLFAADGFHPKQPGRVIMAELIADAIFPNWKPLEEG